MRLLLLLLARDDASKLFCFFVGEVSLFAFLLKTYENPKLVKMYENPKLVKRMKTLNLIFCLFDTCGESTQKLHDTSFRAQEDKRTSLCLGEESQSARDREKKQRDTS